MTWHSSRDLLGLDLDDVLEGYEVDFTVDTCDLDPAKLDEADAYRHRIVLDDDDFDAFSQRIHNPKPTSAKALAIFAAIGKRS